MKNNLKMVVIAIAATLIVAVGCFVNFKNNTKEKTVKLEFMVYDAKDKSDTLTKTVIAKEKEVVKLGTENAITIEEINDDDIKISRDVIKYKVISEEDRKAEHYKERVTEVIAYGKNISIDVDAHDPFGPAYEAPRYHNYIKVVKNY